MTLRLAPNSWIAHAADAATVLTYAFQTDPAPLTNSTSGEEPLLGSLEIVITNATSAAVSLAQWAINVPVGSGASLMQTNTNVETAVSDPDNWSFTGPQGAVTESARFTLLPLSSDASLAPNASLSVQIFNFATPLQATTVTLSYTETIANTPSATNDVSITVFPAGFFFNGLAASVTAGSGLQAVAQVANGTPVVLTWNISVVDVDTVTIFYSDEENGQQSAQATEPNSWTSPPLTSETVFTVVVTGQDPSGDPLPPVSLSTSVAVQNADLVARSVTATSLDVNGGASITGNANIGIATISSATIGSATVSGGATIGGALDAGATLDVAGDATFNGSVNVTGESTTLAGLAVSGNSTLASLAVSGTIQALAAPQPIASGFIDPTSYTASCDGYVAGSFTWTMQVGTACLFATNSTGIIAAATAQISSGNIGKSSFAWITPGSFCLPIRMNEKFTICTSYPPLSGSGGLTPQFFFIPFGTGSASATALVEEQAALLRAAGPMQHTKEEA